MRPLLPLGLAFSLMGCAATGLRQGELLNIESLMRSHRENAVATYSHWENKYVQVSGVVQQTGFIDKKKTTTVLTGNAYYAKGEAVEETVRYPFVVIQPAEGPATVKCVLEPGWSGDLSAANRGSSIRVSAHFVSIEDGPPVELTLRECRVREVHASRVETAFAGSAL